MGKGRGFEHSSHGFNRHHLLARQIGGTNHEDNIKIMEVVKHRALHVLYGNLPPVQQLQQSVGINSTALSDDFRYEVWKLLDTWAKEGRGAYNPKVLKWNR